jgi:hypothetical protein
MLLLNFIKNNKKKLTGFSPPLGEMPQAEGEHKSGYVTMLSPPLGEMPQAEGVSSQN